MRLVALMGLAFVALLTSAAGATAKSAAYKIGTYKLKPAGYTVTLKRTTCGGKVQLCVALPKSPSIQTKGGPETIQRIGNFATPVALPASGKVTEHAPTPGPELEPGVPCSATPGCMAGQSVFSVAFKKNGTLRGYVEVSVTEVIGGRTLSESGKISFTGRLA
jgi:hypothetical protein